MATYRHDDYQAERAKALSVIREETVNGTTVGLFRMPNGNTRKYKIVTTHGGTQTATSDRFIHADFERWVKALGGRKGTGPLVAAVASALDAIQDDITADATIAANAAFLSGR